MDVVKDMCRICLENTGNIISMFTTKFANSETLVATLFNKITNLKIDRNNLHHSICLDCYSKLEEVFHLINQCQHSNRLLKDAIFLATDVEHDQRQLIDLFLEREDGEPMQANFEVPTNNEATFLVVINESDSEQHSTSEETNPVSKRVKLESKEFSCQQCDKSCVTSSGLQKHMKVHQTENVNKVYQCEICSESFSYKSDCNVHMLTHLEKKSYICPICNRQFSQRSSFNYHQKTHNVGHGGDAFQCNICGKKFITMTTLKYHIRIHTNERPFVCKVCRKAFTENKNLLQHEKIHSGISAVLCTICGKKFAASHLRIHMRAHTGERPFLCTLCGKGFYTKQLLKKHVRVHTGERPYVCDICGKSFSQNGGLIDHWKVHKREIIGTNKEQFVQGAEAEDESKVHKKGKRKAVRECT